MAIETTAPATTAAPGSAPSGAAPAKWSLKSLASLELSFGGKGQVKKPTEERIRFTERLALQIESGVALHAALRTMQQQAGDPAVARILEAVLTDVLEGRPFSQALSRHPTLFPASYVNLIGASETGGFMHEVLKQLVAMDEKQEQLRSTIASALAYPVILMCFSVAVVLFVLVVVFPKFADMFASIRGQLPFTTIALMAASDALRQHWMAMAAALAAAAGGVVAWLRKPHGRATVNRLQLRVPLLRQIFVQIYLVRTMRVMSVSLGNGVSVVDTLASCRAVVSNLAFQAFLADVERLVIEGHGVAKGFNESPFIPELVREMIATGEETGNLAPIMGRIADFYERELTKRVNALAKMAEPVMLLVMGTVVGIIVSALILPIFKLSSTMH